MAWATTYRAASTGRISRFLAKLVTVSSVSLLAYVAKASSTILESMVTAPLLKELG